MVLAPKSSSDSFLVVNCIILCILGKSPDVPIKLTMWDSYHSWQFCSVLTVHQLLRPQTSCDYILLYRFCKMPVIVYYSISQYITVHLRVLQYISLYYSISQYITVYLTISQYIQYITVYYQIMYSSIQLLFGVLSVV